MRGTSWTYRAALRAALIVLLLGGLRCGTTGPSGSTTAEDERSVREAAGPDSAAVYVVSHGWHAGIAFQPQGALEELGLIDRIDPEATWLEIGWGDASYYRSPDPGIGTTLKAGLWPTRSVLHVVTLRQRPADRFSRSEVVRFDLDGAARAELEEAIAEAFERGDGGDLRPLGPGLYARSRFYAARGRYHVFNNCNHWTARTLAAAGLPIETEHALTEDQLMEQVRAAGILVRRVRED